MARIAAAVLVLSLVVLAPVRAEATTIFDTTYAWDGSSYISPFGNPDTATYGQTFVAPADNVLDDFTFYLSGDATLEFVAQVYAWSGSLLGGGGGGATGAALYTSPAINLGPTGGVFVPVTVNTGGLSLTTGTNYVALFTISFPTNFSNSSGTDVWGNTQLTHVAGSGGGGFVYYNNLNDPSLLNTTPWDNFADFGDSAWTATFHSAVPEPTSLILLGTGLVGAAVRRRLKQRT